MEVRIGVTQSPRELEVDLGEVADVAALSGEIEAKLAAGGILWLTDKKGRRVGVPTEKVAYIELGGVDDNRRVGFGLG
jgi:hypothetical protein